MLDAVGARFWPYYKGRDAERTPMPWTSEPGGGFSAPGVRPWLPMGDPSACNVADQENDSDSVLSFCRRAIAARQRQRRPGRRLLPVAALARGRVGFRARGSTTVVVNMSDSDATVDDVCGTVILAVDGTLEGGTVEGALSVGRWSGLVVEG